MKIPRDCSGKDIVKALRKFGYEITRQSGSHIILTTQQNGEHHVTVPNHRFLKVGMCRGIIKAVAEHFGVEMEELLRNLGF